MSIKEASSRPQETDTRWWLHLIETGMPIALFAVTFGIMMYAVSMMNGNDEGWNVRSQFLAAQLMLGILVFGILPLVARLRSRTTVDASELRGLNLPRGSIRAMLALWIVGSYTTFLIFAPVLSDQSLLSSANDQMTVGIDTEILNTVITAFGPLVGATLAFYFAGRAATHESVVQQLAKIGRTSGVPRVDSGNPAHDDKPKDLTNSKTGNS